MPLIDNPQYWTLFSGIYKNSFPVGKTLREAIGFVETLLEKNYEERIAYVVDPTYQDKLNHPNFQIVPLLEEDIVPQEKQCYEIWKMESEAWQKLISQSESPPRSSVNRTTA